MNDKINLNGLTLEEVKILTEKYGKNELISVKKENFSHKLVHVISEPMFLLLIVVAIIYFFLGEIKDGIVMLFFVTCMISIDAINEWKTDKTLKKLKDLSEPKITVIRTGKKLEIFSRDLVPGDIMIIHEGIKIPADGYVLKCNGLKCDESSLTGESEGVLKKIYNINDYEDNYFKTNYCYAGTLVINGSAIVLVDKIGNKTEYGKIGINITNQDDNETPLQFQTRKLVKICSLVALFLFIFVLIITFFNLSEVLLKTRIIQSILSGITLAMAMIPEEFPVILTVFLSIGAWRLAKRNSLVKRLSSVETLGAISVLCVDKTGTITKNEMEVESTWCYKTDENVLCKALSLSCNEETFDPMEKAILDYCNKLNIFNDKLDSYKKIKDYPFSNENKLMGCIVENENNYLLCVKGSCESVIKISDLSDAAKKQINKKATDMSNKGFRVLAVGQKNILNEKEIINNIMDEKITFLGLICLMDPIRDNIDKDIDICRKAGIKIVMITGDNGITASAICEKIGIDNKNIITGNEIDLFSDEELCEKVKSVNVFSRVIPEHKMRIVKAFKDNGEIVGMTGDGVNDAPALKSADIGIAMGKRGSEVSREAADLVLLDDNFSTIISTIKDGRRIYDNIKKAVGYVFVIHIPIALASLVAPILGILPENLFLLPIHIVLLELIIDPTCSIVLERQPAENNIMKRKPRKKEDSLVTSKLLLKSFIQGIIIFIGSFITYYIVLKNTNNDNLARSMGLVIIMLSNLFLVQVNSSDNDYVINSIKKLINDKVMWFVNIITIIGIGLILYSPINNFLKLCPLNIIQLLMTIGISFVSVFWYEIIKFIKKRQIVN